MKYIITKCPFCPKEFREDSEELYWHIKIHNATVSGICNHCSQVQYLKKMAFLRDMREVSKMVDKFIKENSKCGKTL